MRTSPIFIAIAIILCIVFPPLALVALILMLVMRLTGFVATETPKARVAGARSAEDWFANV